METVLNGDSNNRTSRYREGAEETKLEPGAAPDDDDDLIITSLQEVIVDEARSLVTNMLAAVPHMGKEAVEQLFLGDTHSAQGGICTMTYDTVEHVILDQNRTVLFGNTMTKHADQYFEAGKAAKAIGKR